MFIGKKIQVPGQRDVSYAALIVLKAISDFPEGSYGYSLMQVLTKKYNWNVKSGTVYPILKRLVEKKFIQKKEGESRQKLYLMTPLGHELLKSLETELNLIEARASPLSLDIDAFLAKVETDLNDDPEGVASAKIELVALRAKLAQIIDLIDKKLAA